jgi:CD109 antigen
MCWQHTPPSPTVWRSGGHDDTTYLGGYGAIAAIETTALVAQALLRAEAAPRTWPTQAINYLVANRDPNGAFYTTQATVQALKALVLAAHSSGDDGAARITVELTEPSGKVSIRTFNVEGGAADVVQQLAFENIGGDANQLQITVEGDRTLHYQLVTSYYSAVAATSSTTPETVTEPMRVAVAYDRTELTGQRNSGGSGDSRAAGAGDGGHSVGRSGHPTRLCAGDRGSGCTGAQKAPSTATN